MTTMPCDICKQPFHNYGTPSFFDPIVCPTCSNAHLTRIATELILTAKQFNIKLPVLTNMITRLYMGMDKMTKEEGE
jgi:hypothetical protein